VSVNQGWEKRGVKLKFVINPESRKLNTRPPFCPCLANPSAASSSPLAFSCRLCRRRGPWWLQAPHAEWCRGLAARGEISPWAASSELICARRPGRRLASLGVTHAGEGGGCRSGLPPRSVIGAASGCSEARGEEAVDWQVVVIDFAGGGDDGGAGLRSTEVGLQGNPRSLDQSMVALSASCPPWRHGLGASLLRSILVS
jgi:hypothetical protein